MSLRTPLARAKGLGPSGEGSHHWWVQRLTAIALIPLSIWFAFSIVHYIGQSHDDVLAWIATPHVALLLVLFLGFMFFHAQLGLQVVIEDYIHSEGLKITMLLFVKGLAFLAGAGAIFAILRIAL